MYKLLLCWRYLRTRYIALASIVSVTLGVATMIVVNSVMQGFTGEMQNRIRGVVSDVIVKGRSLDGMPDYPSHAEAMIRKAAGDQIESMSPTVVVPAILNFQNGNNRLILQVDLVGIDEQSQSEVSEFGGYLQHPENRRAMSFDLREDGYDVRDHQSGSEEVPERKQMAYAGWKHRRKAARIRAFQEKYLSSPLKKGATAGLSSSAGRNTRENTAGQASSGTRTLENRLVQRAVRPEKKASPSADPFAGHPIAEENRFDPARQQHAGAVLGIAMTCFRTHDGENRFSALPGDDVKLTFPTVGRPPKVVSDNFTIVDFYESKMSEYDSKFVFVPIRKLQKLRGMIDPTTGVGRINAIQIKLKPGVDGVAVRDKLRAVFPPESYCVNTWRDEQGVLLAAVDMETRILNILLFMIIAVAGFGILAIFYMIVVEKTRDIGILKSLGASSRGVMAIFLGYGLSLGIIGSGVGMAIGLLFVHYINEIADFIGWLTGQPVFDPSIYYFYKIPAVVLPWTVFWIVFGALAIAVLASILPARRAARLHPVEALRYE